ncbi:J domain-containing protein [Marivirga arenosa]|uniref:DnaJ domain-containing protein n=1 Tax=Marivirga arenosa TaxID=3059076 RepID=A0AA52EWH2_9BACT|nr:DnaJ domain-containing protein [Marivirga sp. BKB1-2]WNB17945.1 DnaJ domain-containing protein [Marivirga sp. BKB1-2]
MSKNHLTYNQAIEILELQHNATTDEIKLAYRRLAKKYHPDIYKLDNGEKFKSISQAYEFLNQNPYPPIQGLKNSRPNSGSQSKHEYRKRAYFEKKRKKQAEEKAQKEQMFKWLFKKIKPILIIFLLFNITLAIDFLLPYQNQKVRVIKIKTDYFRSRNYSSTKKVYDYALLLDNGNKFRIGTKEISVINIGKTLELKRTSIFHEPIKLKISDDNYLIPEYGLFQIFGLLIPVNLLLIIVYFRFLKNNDIKLTIALLLIITTLIQLFLFIL